MKQISTNVVIDTCLSVVRSEIVLNHKKELGAFYTFSETDRQRQRHKDREKGCFTSHLGLKSSNSLCLLSINFFYSNIVEPYFDILRDRFLSLSSSFTPHLKLKAILWRTNSLGEGMLQQNRFFEYDKPKPQSSLTWTIWKIHRCHL